VCNHVRYEALVIRRILVRQHGAVFHSEMGTQCAFNLRQLHSEAANLHLTIAPADCGFAPAPLAKIKGGGPEENAARLKALLQGYGTRTEKQAVAINAGTLLLTAGMAPSLRDGAELVFHVRRRDGMSDEEFAADADHVARDLETLRRILESD